MRTASGLGAGLRQGRRSLELSGIWPLDAVSHDIGDTEGALNSAVCSSACELTRRAGQRHWSQRSATDLPVSSRWWDGWRRRDGGSRALRRRDRSRAMRSRGPTTVQPRGHDDLIPAGVSKGSCQRLVCCRPRTRLRNGRSGRMTNASGSPRRARVGSPASSGGPHRALRAVDGRVRLAQRSPSGGAARADEIGPQDVVEKLAIEAGAADCRVRHWLDQDDFWNGAAQPGQVCSSKLEVLDHPHLRCRNEDRAGLVLPTGDGGGMDDCGRRAHAHR
jgi:hypothetical protein